MKVHFGNISGIEFDTRIPGRKISKVIAVFNKAAEHIKGRTDTSTFVEHRMVGSTIAYTRSPLTPYLVQSCGPGAIECTIINRDDEDERYKGKMGAYWNPAQLSSPTSQVDSRVALSFPNQTAKDELGNLMENAGLAKDDRYTRAIFERFTINPKTGTVVSNPFPRLLLLKQSMREEKEVTLPDDLSNDIRFGQLTDDVSWVNGVKLRLVVDDENICRFELKE